MARELFQDSAPQTIAVKLTKSESEKDRRTAHHHQPARQAEGTMSAGLVAAGVIEGR